MNICPDCGAPVDERFAGIPPQLVAFDTNGDYHDSHGCIRYLKERLHRLEYLMVKYTHVHP